MQLRLQGKRNRKSPTVSEVRRAVRSLARSNGPTYVILDGANGDYAQVAGTDGRYLVETRIALGEGFLHFRVVRPWPSEDHEVVVHYDCGSCSKHAQRRCPLKARASEVCTLSHAETALVEFVRSGLKSPELQWRDVTGEFATDYGADDIITAITPTRVHK